MYSQPLVPPWKDFLYPVCSRNSPPNEQGDGERRGGMEKYNLQLSAHTTRGGCFVNIVCLSSILWEVGDIKRTEGKGEHNTRGGDVSRNGEGNESPMALGHGAPDCAALRAGADGVACVFHIDSRDDGTALGQDGAPDAEVGVWAWEERPLAVKLLGILGEGGFICDRGRETWGGRERKQMVKEERYNSFAFEGGALGGLVEVERDRGTYNKPGPLPL